MDQTLLANIRQILTVLAIIFVAYYIVLWVAAMIWTYRDIHSRSEDLLAQVLSVALVFLFHFPGLLIYIILRPRQTLIERYERALEEEYMRRDIEDPYVCSHCQRPIEQEFILCPYCQTELRRRCHGCDRAVDLTWPVCPYCATPAGAGYSKVLLEPARQI